MKKNNYQRMMQVIDEVFSTRNDPDQLQVTASELKKLQEIHPDCLSEIADENGPLIWVLMIPTTKQVMDEFLACSITEKELLARTNVGDTYTAIYLCSVTTLPEMRGKGKTKDLCLTAIRSISKDHPIKILFVWPFTEAGNKLAKYLANETGLKLFARKN